MENSPIMIALIQNAALLLAMALIFDVTMRRWQMAKVSIRQVLVGIAIGGIGITLMMTPWQFVPGIIFDTRSILLSISGLFFGLVPTLIAVLMTAAFRIYQGGAATVMGVSVIITTAALGVAWRQWHKERLERIQWHEFFLFGVVCHVVMLLLTFTLPIETAVSVLKAIALPVMVIYPLGTAFLGELMAGRLRRQQLAAELAESEERLRLAVAAGNIGFFERDLQSGKAHFSVEWKQQIGYRDDELQNDTLEWQNRVHPDDLPVVLEKVDQCAAGSAISYEAEYRLRHKSGAYRWILARGEVIKDAQGKPWRLVGCHVDITQLKYTENALVTSRNQYRLLTESLKDVIWVLDADTLRFRYISPSVERLRGYTPEEFMAAPLGLGLQPEQTEALLQHVRTMADALREGKINPDEFFENEALLGRKDGSTIWTEIVTNYYINAETRHVEIRGVTRDISERRAVQEQIQRMNVELERRVQERTTQLQAANQELEAFAYSVSHDLRAPLRAIDGFSRALQEDYIEALDAQGQHYFRRIREAVSHMGNLIDDLLNLSRISRSELNPAPLDLSALAQSVAGALLARQQQREIELEVAPGMQAIADENLMKIVLENLISNAIKFSAGATPPRIQVGADRQDGKTVFYVKDNGVGFDMAYADKLFVPFQRLHSAAEFPGTGIGLVTVKRIITRHGGRVWTEAAPDTGAAFYFTLTDME
jgi:PAS domain S-box-containing protein